MVVRRGATEVCPCFKIMAQTEGVTKLMNISLKIVTSWCGLGATGAKIDLQLLATTRTRIFEIPAGYNQAWLVALNDRAIAIGPECEIANRGVAIQRENEICFLFIRQWPNEARIGRVCWIGFYRQRCEIISQIGVIQLVFLDQSVDVGVKGERDCRHVTLLRLG